MEMFEFGKRFAWAKYFLFQMYANFIKVYFKFYIWSPKIQSMSSLLLKAAILALVFAFAISQTPSNDSSANYLSQQCCPKGYNSAGVYCVKCNEPKHWDALNQRCVTC